MFALFRPIMKEVNVALINESLIRSLQTSCSLCCKNGIKNPVKKRGKPLKDLPLDTQKISTNELSSYMKVALKLEADKPNEQIRRDNKTTSVQEIIRKYPDKVRALAESLDCSEDYSAELFRKYTFLTRSKMSTIDSKIETLIGGGILKEELISDLWILTYTNSTLEERLNLLHKLNLLPVKPWLLRCSTPLLHRMSKNRESNRLAMGRCGTVADYLKKRLSLNDMQVKFFASRHPPVMRVKVSKLKEMIDFLYGEGFTSSQLYQTPRILCHSVLTIQERLKQLKRLNYLPHSLTILCKSQRSFDKFLKNIDK